MKRLVPLLVFLAALAMSQAAHGQVQLRTQVTVEGDVITLGDLFVGAGRLAPREVGPAPAPGRSAVYKASHLAAIARAHGLRWRPASSVTRSIVRRGGDSVEADEIIALLRREFRRQGATGRIKIYLNRLRDVVLQPGDGGQLRVDELTFDGDGGSFSAYLRNEGPGSQAQQHLLRGRVDFVARVPVPSRSIRKGQKITRADVKWAELSLRLLGPETVEDMAQVVGLAAKRNLRQNQPIKPTDLRAPIMIAKGSLVTVSLRNGGLRLSSTGRALEDGSHGETIRIMNMQSKRIVEASVIGPNQVRATLGRQIAVAAKR